MSTGLLATKLYHPPLRSSFVPRPRLVERLRTGLSGKLTLLVAPAGFGKTTLVSEALGGQPVAWVSLDGGDSDATRFWSYVLAALDTLAPGVGASARALLEAPQAPAPEALLTVLLNALSDQDLVADATLVLDDYHVIAGAAVHAGVSYLLEHMPARLHLVIATRADPPVRLARLRARAELTELRAADLRFTADETTSFLSDVMGLPLSIAESAALERRTEGWIAGLQLAALAMRGHADPAGFIGQFAGSNRFVVDYLAEEVFEGQPAHIQTFLLQTSILDRLCGPLCDALLLGAEAAQSGGARAYSQVLLEELEHGNLFIEPLDDERRWYRYHQLFAEVLRGRLQHGASGDLIATLYARAGRWCEEQELVDEAVRYALSGSDFDRAAELVERYAAPLILGSSAVFQVRSWIEQLPRELIVGRPRLVLAAGIALILTGKPSAVEQLLAERGARARCGARNPWRNSRAALDVGAVCQGCRNDTRVHGAGTRRATRRP